MNKPDSYSNNKQSADSISLELKKSIEREKKLEKALFEVFPVDLYRQVKALPDEYDDDSKVIDHFVNYGIKEMNLKEIIKDSITYDPDIPKNQYRHIQEAAELIALELTESRDRVKKLSLKASAGCLRDSGITNINNFNHIEADAERIFLKTQGNPTNLFANENYQFAINHTKVHYKSNSVCTWIPKNACSNLRCSIAIANGAIASVEEIKWIHANNDCFVASTKEALEAEFTFIILRNPFKRLLSYFLDKLCHADDPQEDISYQIAKGVFDFKSEMSFEDFINYIWEYPHTIYEDEHTRPQCDFVLYRNYDRYYSIEGLEDAIREIQTKTGLKFYDVRGINSIYTTKDHDYNSSITYQTTAVDIKNRQIQKQSPVAKNMYSKEMIKKVAAIYLQDIILYLRRVSNGSSELDYWIQRAF